MKIYTSTFLLFFSLTLMAQSNYYYYYKGEKRYLSLDKSSANINVENTLNMSSLRNSYNLRDFSLEDDNSLTQPSTYKYAKITFQETLTEARYFEKLRSIKSHSGVRTVFPNFRGSNGEEIGTSDYLYVKLKNSNDYQTLLSVASQKMVSVVEQNKFMPLWYTLRCSENTVENTLEVANYFFQTGLFASATPDFLTDMQLQTNDPFYSDQWGLNNNGQYSSSNEIDINLSQAWTISKGDNVIVAVFDDGIELDHPDLISNIHSKSYDTVTERSPSVVRRGHGTACAGIIAATKDNNKGIVGVSPNSKLMSISSFPSGPHPGSDMRIANGINWASENGAHIISNSWRWAENDLVSGAISNVLANGRGGKGTIVVFAAGNSNKGEVLFPANSNDDIISVGAMSPCGERKNPSSCDGENWGSSYGNSLDVVAPGVFISTTDRQGDEEGYNPPKYSGYNDYSNTDYTKFFRGTSSAAPHVAGVAALILSVNPDLTVQEVNTIIESTAQKVGNYSYTNNPSRPNGTWNNEMGYGLIDAYAAVQMAQQVIKSCYVEIRRPESSILERIIPHGVIPPEEVLTEHPEPPRRLGESPIPLCLNKSTTIDLGNNREPVSWLHSPNLEIESSSNNHITVKAISAEGDAYVKAVLPNRTITKNITINVAPSITFPNTQLTETLLNNNSNIGSLNLNNHIITSGQRLSVNLNTNHANLSWRHTREDYYSSTEIPYKRCVNSINNKSLQGRYDLIDYHFSSTPDHSLRGTPEIPRYPPITVTQSGLLEVEATACNECGCDAKNNSYIVLPEPDSRTKFKTRFSMSPNPANSLVNILLVAPERERVFVNFRDLQTGEDNFVEIGTIAGDIRYDYIVTVYNLINGMNAYDPERFHIIDTQPPRLPRLLGPNGHSSNQKTIPLDVSGLDPGFI